MEKLPQLNQMKSEEKDALIYELWEKIQKLEAELKKYREKTKKTSKNSSIPPSKEQKRNLNKIEKKSRSKNHSQGGRNLSKNPDRIIKVYAEVCNCCGVEVVQQEQKQQRCYEKIEIPKIKAIVSQIRTYGGECSNCGGKYEAKAGAGLEEGSPFGKSITEAIVYWRYNHFLSYERLKKMMWEMYRVEISEGGIANLLRRAKEEVEESVEEIVEKIRTAKIVGSDETSARVRGKNEWEWVFQNDQVCYHIIEPSRGGDVLKKVMADQKPEVWVSDLFSAQKTHSAQTWQVCLAHQIRDCQYAIDQGDKVFTAPMQKLLLEAMRLHHRREQLSTADFSRAHCKIKENLKRILQLNPEQEDGLRLKKRYQSISENLFLFLDNPQIPPTNNASEQALRLSVIFRKVTNGFRSDWGKELFADIRSIMNTGKRQGLSALESIHVALDPHLSFFSPR